MISSFIPSAAWRIWLGVCLPPNRVCNRSLIVVLYPTSYPTYQSIFITLHSSDVAFVCATAPTYVGKWWRDAVADREKKKHDKYGPLLVIQGTRGGLSYQFLPFVHTVHGDVGAEAEQFIT